MGLLTKADDLPEGWGAAGDRLGWLGWYRNYAKGVRTEHDDDQIGRWHAVKPRFEDKMRERPTARLAAAMLGWGLNPFQHVDEAKGLEIADQLSSMGRDRGKIGPASKYASEAVDGDEAARRWGFDGYACPKCGATAYAGDAEDGAPFRGSAKCSACAEAFSTRGLKPAWSPVEANKDALVSGTAAILSSFSNDELDGISVWVNPERKRAHVDVMDWGDGAIGRQIARRLHRFGLTDNDIHTANEEPPPDKKQGWVKVLPEGPVKDAYMRGCVKAGLAVADLREAEKTVETSPSRPQQEAGNYAKGHLAWKGLDITIEQPKGSTRKGKDWEHVMQDAYGYFKRTRGADGDQVDVFICDEDLDSEIVFVVNQNKKDRKTFDEVKCVIGTHNAARAKEIYLRNYQDGWTGFDSIRPMTLADFKTWLDKGDMSKRADEHGLTVAVDLDGTLAEKQEPFDPASIGPPIPGRIEAVNRLSDGGASVIIWTVRDHPDLVRRWLAAHGVRYDHINENPNQPEGSSGKVYADVYVDDRAVNATDLDALADSLAPAGVATGCAA